MNITDLMAESIRENTTIKERQLVADIFGVNINTVHRLVKKDGRHKKTTYFHRRILKELIYYAQNNIKNKITEIEKHSNILNR